MKEMDAYKSDTIDNIPHFIHTGLFSKGADKEVSDFNKKREARQSVSTKILSL